MFAKALAEFQKGNVGEGGEDLRGFILGGFSNRIYSPKQMRLLLEKSVLAYDSDVLNRISLPNFSTILESCVFNNMVGASEL